MNTDGILARFGLMRQRTAYELDARPPDLVVRQTTSRETSSLLGVMHEAKCKHCPWHIELDTLSSCLERGRKHLREEHGILIDRLRDVKLGAERWD